ncbi:MAG: hypothetical protein DYG89_27070 [Caldilinea sp. CFX5]|nr:hypothetical protein [Caldilinea sp. CFX5]
MTRLLLVFLVVFLLSGSTPVTESTNTAHSCPPLTAGVTPLVTLVAQWDDLSSAPVIALDYSDNGQQLTVVYPATYEHFGEVLTMESKTGKIVRKLNTIWIHPEGTALSPTGNILATVQERPEIVQRHRNELDVSYGIINFVEIWDINSGVLRNSLAISR